MYDCFLPPSHACMFFQCQTLAQRDVSYFHNIMEKSYIQGSDAEYKAPKVKTVPTANDVGINCGNIQHVAHFYTTYVNVPGYATFDEPPSTPAFLRIKFYVPETTAKELRENGFAG